MNRNIDGVERLVRFALGLGFLAWIPFESDDFRWFGLVGIYPLATALLGFCPLYRSLGIDTRRSRR